MGRKKRLKRHSDTHATQTTLIKLNRELRRTKEKDAKGLGKPREDQQGENNWRLLAVGVEVRVGVGEQVLSEAPHAL